jgi:hypothetical protein
MPDGESPAMALLRALDVDPDAPLVNEPPKLGLHPSTSELTAEERAEREAAAWARDEAVTANARGRRDAMRRRSIWRM